MRSQSQGTSLVWIRLLPASSSAWARTRNKRVTVAHVANYATLDYCDVVAGTRGGITPSILAKHYKRKTRDSNPQDPKRS